MRCERCPVRSGTTCVGESHPAICARAADPAEAGFRARLGRPRGASPDFPPPIVQAANLAGAVGRFVASGLATTTREERERRLAICRGCEHFVEDRRCLKCGCRLRYKIAMSGEHCPLDLPRW